MDSRKINGLIVVNANRNSVGALNMHDLLNTRRRGMTVAHTRTTGE
jgi:hypothetical protein